METDRSPAMSDWQLVPKDVTEEMFAAFRKNMVGTSFSDLWKAMLAAAPSTPTSVENREAIKGTVGKECEGWAAPAEPVADDAETVERMFIAVPRQDVERLADNFDNDWSGERSRPELIKHIERIARGWLKNNIPLSVASPVARTDDRLEKLEGLKVGFLICPRCGERIETDKEPDGCRDPDCPMQGTNR